MKKQLVGAVVGGIIIFVYQFLSWAALNLHHASQQYTPKQDSILSYLSSQFSEDGSYLLPNYPKGMSHEDMERQMASTRGKPWAQIQYHQAMNMNMGMNIVAGLVADIIMVAFICWIITKLASRAKGVVFTVCLFTGMIVFINSPYTIHIWYPKADIWVHFLDALLGWSLCGIWLGWWFSRKKDAAATTRG